MSDYDSLKDIFEMAEVLESTGESTLKILAPSEENNNVTEVYFKFNKDKELVEVYV